MSNGVGRPSQVNRSHMGNDPDALPQADSNPVRSDLIRLPQIIGFPPEADSGIMKNLQANAIPIVLITPCVPRASVGLNLFSPEQAFAQYARILESHGYTYERPPLKVAFIPDTPVTETITNEYGESFLNKITDVTAGFNEMNQIFGGQNIIETAQKWQTLGKEMGGVAGLGFRGAGAVGETVGEGVRKFANAISAGSGDLATKLLAGARIDFPFVWKNSSYSITTSITVRLYNPQPGHDQLQQERIVGPLVALLCLATPISDMTNVYNWPFFHKIKCPGYFDINPGAISSISITRGAENQISFSQRPSLVDVRIEFAVLHSVMLNSTEAESTERPSVKQLKESLSVKRKTQTLKLDPPEKTGSSVRINSQIEENLKLVKTSRNTSLPQSVEPNLDIIKKRATQSNLDKAEQLSSESDFYG